MTATHARDIKVPKKEMKLDSGGRHVKYQC
jgi:hypothetical protein